MKNNASFSRQFAVIEGLNEMMAAYDDLPRAVRDVLKYAVSDFAMKGLAKEVRRALARNVCEAEIVRKMRLAHETHDAKECYRIYGPDHPQSDNFGRRLRPNHIAVWGKPHD